MAKDDQSKKSEREKLSLVITIISLLIILIIALIAIWKDAANNTMTVFNMVLPVVATWVGTIIAFYFGRENFVAATNQVEKFTRQMTRVNIPDIQVKSVMKSLDNIVYFLIPAGKSEKEIKLNELRKLLGGKINRMPVLDENKVAKYMIHLSSIDRYLVEGGKLEDSLESFLSKMKTMGFVFGINSAFIILSEKATLGVAKNKMAELDFCKDIFITKGGGTKEPVTGWISDVMLANFVEE